MRVYVLGVDNAGNVYCALLNVTCFSPRLLLFLFLNLIQYISLGE